jgi:hypothetical protein
MPSPCHSHIPVRITKSHIAHLAFPHCRVTILSKSTRTPKSLPACGREFPGFRSCSSPACYNSLFSNRAPTSPEHSWDRKELLNFILKVHSKLAGGNGCFSDNQHNLCYIYGYLKGNAQNQIQPYIQTDNMSLQDIEASIKILEAAFGGPDEVRMASGELHYLMPGNREFSIYHAEFQRLMVILDYDSKVKRAALK